MHGVIARRVMKLVRPTLVNLKTAYPGKIERELPKDAVYIGRQMQGFARSPWANPHKIGPMQTRETVCSLYEEYVRSQS